MHWSKSVEFTTAKTINMALFLLPMGIQISVTLLVIIQNNQQSVD